MGSHMIDSTFFLRILTLRAVVTPVPVGVAAILHGSVDLPDFKVGGVPSPSSSSSRFENCVFISVTLFFYIFVKHFYVKATNS